MATAEESHWWYVGLRDMIGRIVKSPRFAVPRDGKFLDAGCGTGANLRLLSGLTTPRVLEGFDAHPRSIRLAARKCPEADLYLDDIRRPTVRDDGYDLVLCCDVISLVGWNACLEGLRNVVDRMSDGGLLILHAPACKWLYSNHDRAVGNIERYRLSEIQSFMELLGLRVELLTYRMSVLLPIVAACRRFPGAARVDDEPHSDLGRGPESLVPIWRRIVAGENGLTIRGLRWPIGSSILAVGRK